MAHLLLLGSWKGLADVAALLHAEHTVTLVARLGSAARIGEDGDGTAAGLSGFNLLLAEAEDARTLEGVSALARRLGIAWLTLCTSPDPALASAAYRAGAMAVLPCDASPDVVHRAAVRLLGNMSGGNSRNERGSVSASHLWQRRYRSGERIPLDPENTLEVKEGIVALTVIHADGAEVLLGLCGAGQILAGHPDDACCIQLYAQTDAAVVVQPWAEASRNGALSERLRDRLGLMEAWAAMQARPQTEQRLLGILSLLAEQFGRPTAKGTRIEVKVTHAQLASAVGATRTTVTRLLGELRRRGLLVSEGAGSGERLCLRQWESAHPARAAI